VVQLIPDVPWFEFRGCLFFETEARTEMVSQHPVVMANALVGVYLLSAAILVVSGVSGSLLQLL
jgi:hypothetical protein